MAVVTRVEAPSQRIDYLEPLIFRSISECGRRNTHPNEVSDLSNQQIFIVSVDKRMWPSSHASMHPLSESTNSSAWYSARFQNAAVITRIGTRNQTSQNSKFSLFPSIRECGRRHTRRRTLSANRLFRVLGILLNFRMRPS